MPPRGRGRATAPDLSKTLTLGFVGTGVITPEEVEGILNNLYSAEGIEKVHAIFALTDDGLGKADLPGAYAAFQQSVALAEQVSEDVLTISAVTYPDGNDDDKALHDEAVEGKVNTIAIGDQAAVTVVDELVKAKSAGSDTRLVLFWVTEDDPNADTGAQYAALESAGQAGIPGFNACDRMDDMNLGQPAAEEPPAEEPAAEAPKRGRGRPRGTTTAAAAEDKPAGEAPPTRRRRGSTAPAAASGDEAQAELPLANGHVDLSDAGVGDIIDAFANIIAKRVVALLQSGEGEATPARRGR